MAKSPAHKLGQLIGDTFEEVVKTLLADFADRHDLYLDTHGTRPARRGKKLTWTDSEGNSHDLDFVLERDGTDEEIGRPVAFIESAYRRYTKHSRNKAQEVQGAILPLKRTYWRDAPFIGVVLAGVFTRGAIDQLESLGFSVLYLRFSTVVRAFRSVGVDVQFGEDTPEDEHQAKVDSCLALDDDQWAAVFDELIDINRDEVTSFLAELEDSVTRGIESVRVIPLHGDATLCESVADAIQFVAEYDDEEHGHPLRRFEVQIRYTNGDRIDAQFSERERALEFLKGYA